jgi:hypothetical protein
MPNSHISDAHNRTAACSMCSDSANCARVCDVVVASSTAVAAALTIICSSADSSSSTSALLAVSSSSSSSASSLATRVTGAIASLVGVDCGERILRDRNDANRLAADAFGVVTLPVDDAVNEEEEDDDVVIGAGVFGIESVRLRRNIDANDDDDVDAAAATLADAAIARNRRTSATCKRDSSCTTRFN